jgi:hypothetical protein
MGVSDSEKKRLLDSYQALKEKGYRSSDDISETRRSGAAR